MLILEPLKNFLVDFKINNPSDTATYYVQAVIKDSVNGTVLATLNLTDNGNQYFSKVWTAANDQSGTGLQITITTTVYSDSGYTTISPIYGAQVNNYIVRHLASQLLGGWERSGVKVVDYAEIEKVIRKVVAEIAIPEGQKVDLRPIVKSIEELGERQVLAEANHDIRATQGEDFTKKTVAEHHEKLIKLSRVQMENLRNEMMEKIEEHEASGMSRHESAIAAIDELREKFDGIVKNIEGMGTDFSSKHAAIIEQMKKPIELKLKREEKEENEEADVPTERRMTIEKLLSL